MLMRLKGYVDEGLRHTNEGYQVTNEGRTLAE